MGPYFQDFLIYSNMQICISFLFYFCFVFVSSHVAHLSLLYSYIFSLACFPHFPDLSLFCTLTYAKSLSCNCAPTLKTRPPYPLTSFLIFWTSVHQNLLIPLCYANEIPNELTDILHLKFDFFPRYTLQKPKEPKLETFDSDIASVFSTCISSIGK